MKILACKQFGIDVTPLKQATSYKMKIKKQNIPVLLFIPPQPQLNVFGTPLKGHIPLITLVISPPSPDKTTLVAQSKVLTSVYIRF